MEGHPGQASAAGRTTCVSRDGWADSRVGASEISMTDPDPVAYPNCGVTCAYAPVEVLARNVAAVVLQARTPGAIDRSVKSLPAGRLRTRRAARSGAAE